MVFDRSNGSSVLCYMLSLVRSVVSPVVSNSDVVLCGILCCILCSLRGSLWVFHAFHIVLHVAFSNILSGRLCPL